MNITAFEHDLELVNEEKAERALHGTLSRGAVLVGGVGDDATPEQLVAEYDRLGGLVRLDGDNVVKGSFYDFKKKKPITEPAIKLIFNINGKKVAVDASEPLPPLVRAAKEAEQGTASEAEEKEAKPKGKKGNLIGGGKKAKEAESEYEG